MTTLQTQRSKGTFANPAVVVESWYIAAKSSDVECGHIMSTDDFGKRLAIWRDTDGEIHIVDGQCAHLGADLGQGRIVNDEIVCAFHCWRWGKDGTCAGAPGFDETPKRSLRTYPSVEKHGFIWVYLGKSPKFDVPDGPTDRKCWRVSTPSQYIGCHGQLVVVNGLDEAHFAPLHDFHTTRKPTMSKPDEHSFSMLMHSRPKSRLARWVTKSLRRDIETTFTTIGSNIALLTVHSPLKYQVIFTARPAGEGCYTQTIAFLPRRPLEALRSLASAFLIVKDDAPVLNRLQFMPAYTDLDRNLREFAEYVETLDVFHDSTHVE